MKFQDIIHGAIDFGPGPVRALVGELVATPEVQRLRSMRMLNQDAPYMQELSTSRRFAHAVGTAYVANRLVRKSKLSARSSQLLISAALLHDIGILPYGHLVERELSNRDPSFSHELLVEKILFGTYHPSNVYHQLLPGRSLRVWAVLGDWSISPSEVIPLVAPKSAHETAIAGSLDIDNIDNVHRMAALLGYSGVRENLELLLSGLEVEEDLSLSLKRSHVPALNRWLAYRAAIYSQMIAHPECVAYNAFLQDLVRAAVDAGVISTRDWFLSDRELDQRLEETPSLRQLALQRLRGFEYSLVDYVWIDIESDYVHSIDNAVCDRVVEKLGDPPLLGSVHRCWLDKNKVTRRIVVRTEDGGPDVVVGRESARILIALIDPGRVTRSGRRVFEGQRPQRRWRENVGDALAALDLSRVATLSYPEDFEEGVRRSINEPGQLPLFPQRA